MGNVLVECETMENTASFKSGQSEVAITKVTQLNQRIFTSATELVPKLHPANFKSTSWLCKKVGVN